jgi:hypothetical protein
MQTLTQEREREGGREGRREKHRGKDPRMATIGRCVCYAVWESNLAPCDKPYASLGSQRSTPFSIMKQENFLVYETVSSSPDNQNLHEDQTP